jgi:Arc/MetJ-type ribon-helix-helix transcriptional regulator
MTLTLDAATEKRIQREIDLGHYTNPAEVVAHAVAVLDGQAYSKEPLTRAQREAALDESAGAWAGCNGDGLEYQLRMRAEWDDREPALPALKTR